MDYKLLLLTQLMIMLQEQQLKYIYQKREYEIVSYKEMKGKFDKEERTPFTKLVNQLMLKMEASLIIEGSEGYRNLTDFERRITSEIMKKNNVDSIFQKRSIFENG